MSIPDKDTHTLVQAGTRLCPSCAFAPTTQYCRILACHMSSETDKAVLSTTGWSSVCVCVCVSWSSVLRLKCVCVCVRSRVRVQVKAEPSTADKPRQVSLLCLTHTRPLASGGEKPLIGKGWNTHTCVLTAHTQSVMVTHTHLNERQTKTQTDRWTQTSGSEKQLYSELCEADTQNNLVDENTSLELIIHTVCSLTFSTFPLSYYFTTWCFLFTYILIDSTFAV